jgi:hypothetical protein
MKAVLRDVHPSICSEKLRVVGRVCTEEGEEFDAFLPYREVSALLPRSILLGDHTRAPESILTTIEPMLRRLAEGRPVRLWEYRKQHYFSFLSWRNVTFGSAEER